MKLKHQIFAAALATTVALPVAADSRTLDADSSTFGGGYWDALLLHRITPQMDRLNVAPVPVFGWMSLDEQLIAPAFADSLLRPASAPLKLSLSSPRLALTLAPTSTSAGLNTPGITFQQSLLMPGLTRSVTENSDLTISAVLASQSYGNSMHNLVEATNASVADFSAFSQTYYGQPEVSHGAGLRLGLLSRLNSKWSLDAAAQSRIDMNEFANIRGLYGTTAELDIASRVQAGVQFHATSNTSIRFGIEQIYYSEVGAFPSRTLPARFTSLLGDSTSPRFEWDDLTVYSLGWQWSNGYDLSIYVDYQTRTQPLPTSPVLADALSPELADSAFLAGVTKGVGYNTFVRLSASYAPPDLAFGGNSLGVVSDRLDQDVEVQAIVQVDF